ncbi:unnamed protein product [Protopolystoma xenopodis]|uniref:Uncharacterized protein n=1 Tax=Protopolystoma xenopodis TaxID=117903 RepID=A0A3S4ZJ08_9PLAT|nr:unnamed protein product [Protopolystoma xenopodis]
MDLVIWYSRRAGGPSVGLEGARREGGGEPASLLSRNPGTRAVGQSQTKSAYAKHRCTETTPFEARALESTIIRRRPSDTEGTESPWFRLASGDKLKVPESKRKRI